MVWPPVRASYKTVPPQVLPVVNGVAETFCVSIVPLLVIVVKVPAKG